MAGGKLPTFQGKTLSLQLLQDSWSATLNPFLSSPFLQGLLLKDVQLEVGSNVINHRLGRKLVGWVVSRQRGPANLYDTQDSNQRPQLTLLLTSDTAVSVDLYVF